MAQVVSWNTDGKNVESNKNKFDPPETISRPDIIYSCTQGRVELESSTSDEESATTCFESDESGSKKSSYDELDEYSYDSSTPSCDAESFSLSMLDIAKRRTHLYSTNRTQPKVFNCFFVPAHHLHHFPFFHTLRGQI